MSEGGTGSQPDSAAPRAPRRDIQALRAIAVMLVLLNHLWPWRVPGGFVGVDVFFVISGFLITAHLLAELGRSGRINLPRFYARRARRLLPAAVTVSLVSLGAVLVWLPATAWERTVRETLAATAYVENWLLTASAVDYSAQNESATTAQHYWSLSVEEQFYLLWPAVLIALGWLLARKLPGRIAGRRGLLAASVLLIAVLSLTYSVWHTAVAPSAAYFNTFGRVWEFMLGALLAVLAPALAAWFARLSATGPARSAGAAGTVLRHLRGTVQLAGYAAIAWSALAFSETTAFPGPWALVPVVGTAVVIAAGPEVPAWSPARLLHWRPVQYTGDISYSLYLWHWPLVVVAPFALARTLGTADLIAILLASFALAAATKHGIEDPGRTRLFAGARPRRTLLAALGTVVVVALIAVAVSAGARGIQAQQASEREAFMQSDCVGAAALAAGADCGDPFGPASVAPAGEADAPWASSPEECALAPDAEQIMAEGKPTFVRCDFSASQPEGAAAPEGAGGADPDPLNAWLVGDSHAEHWKATVYGLAAEQGWRVSSTMQGGCPIVSVPRVSFLGTPTEPAKLQDCLSWSEEVSQRILEDQPDLVLVSNFASAETIDDGSGRPQDAQLAAAFDSSLAAWADRGARVVVIRDTPTPGAALGPDCVALHGEQSAGCVADAADVLPPDPMVAAVERAGHPGITSVDLSDQFCVDGVCSGVIGGLPVYFDVDHMARGYAATLVPALSERLGL